MLRVTNLKKKGLLTLQNQHLPPGGSRDFEMSLLHSLAHLVERGLASVEFLGHFSDLTVDEQSLLDPWEPLEEGSRKLVPRASGNKADEAKADEAKADEAKVDEAKADEAKADEAKVDEAKADEAKAPASKKKKG